MKNVKLGVVLLGLLAATVAGPAAAQSKDDDKGIYLGGSFGVTHSLNTCKFAAVPCDDKDSAGRVFAGYRFNKSVSAELGYADLGGARGDGPFNGQPGSFQVVNKPFDISAIVTIPVVGQLSAFGRLGLFITRTTLDQEFNGGTTHDGSTNHNYTGGLGLQYNLGPVGIRGEWQRYQNAGTHTTIEDNIDFWSLGLLWRF